MAKKRPQRRRSTPSADVDALLGIQRTETYQDRKVEYDRQRVRLRLDVPSWLKEAVEQEANDQKVSMSQLSAFLLAYGLKLYREKDPAMMELLETSKTTITSLRWAFGIVLDDLEEVLTDSAESTVDVDLLGL